jgi:hypothetical protein
MSRGRRASDTGRPGSPCTSGTAALAIRVRCGGPTVSLLLDGSTAAGISRPGPPDKSGTTHRATQRGRSPRPSHRAERPRRRCDAALLGRHRADPAVGRRSAGSDQGQPWKRADVAALVFRPHSVQQFHLGRISAAAAVHSDFQRFAGISCPPVSVCERSEHPRPSMVRKGSSVRVRQRACLLVLLSAGLRWSSRRRRVCLASAQRRIGACAQPRPMPIRPRRCSWLDTRGLAA